MGLGKTSWKWGKNVKASWLESEKELKKMQDLLGGCALLVLTAVSLECSPKLPTAVPPLPRLLFQPDRGSPQQQNNSYQQLASE